MAIGGINRGGYFGYLPFRKQITDYTQLTEKNPDVLCCSECEGEFAWPHLEITA